MNCDSYMEDRMFQAFNKDQNYFSYQVVKRSDADLDEVTESNTAPLNIIPTNLGSDMTFYANLQAIVEISPKSVIFSFF